MLKLTFSASLCIVIFFAIATYAQEGDVEQVLSEAVQLWQNEKLAQASDLLKKALDTNPGQLEIMRLFAQIEMDRKGWSKAKSLWRKVKEKKSQDLMARYGLGICYRETGKYKALLLRALDWKKSRQYFESVIAKDPGFRDVFCQYAILQRYREQYFSAVDLGEKQLVYHPHSVPSFVELYRNYDCLLAHQPAQDVAKWLKRRSDERSVYFLGELERRRGNWQQSDSIFQSLLSHQNLVIPKIPVFLSLARLRIQQGQENQGGRYLLAAFDSLTSMADCALLFEDMQYAFSDNDLENYEKVSTVEGKRKFLDVFWLRRDPLPASDTNVRLIEHYRRLIYAEENYRYDGFRLEFNNPDKLHYLKFPKIFSLNIKFNDKGLIYIRHGKPDENAITMGQSINQNETWVYYADGIHQKLMFHFFIDNNAFGNNWRLGAELSREMLESRLTLDPIFQHMYMAEPLEQLRYESELAQKSRDDVAIGLNSERHSWSEKIIPVDFSYSIAAFRGDDNITHYDASLALTTDKLWPSAKEFNQDHQVSIGFAVFDTQWKSIYKENLDVTSRAVKDMADTLGFYCDQISFESTSSPMYISMFVKVPQEKKLGGYRFNYQGRKFARTGIQMSDIVLSHKIVPQQHDGSFSKKGLTVIPNPLAVFSKESPLYVYFELYNLPVVGGKPVDFSLQYRLKLLRKYQANILSKLAGIFSKEREETSNLVQRFAEQEMSVEYLALNLNKKAPGRYQLQVIANLPGSGQSGSAATEFDLR